MPRQAKAVRPEGIGLDNLSARLQIIVVDGADQLRLRQVQFVIAAVNEDAFGIEKRPHGSVAEHGRMLQTFNKVLCHLLEDTRRSEVSASAIGSLRQPVVAQCEFVLKGRGFSRAVGAAKSIAALAAEGMRFSNWTTTRQPCPFPHGPSSLVAPNKVL